MCTAAKKKFSNRDGHSIHERDVDALSVAGPSFRLLQLNECSQCRRLREKLITIDAVWRGRLDIQSVPISIAPFGRPGHKSDGNRFTVKGEGDRLGVRCSPGNRRRRGGESD
ncbi:hypothetical protein AVEN_164517-1 [Araneus ventricosus]|uniref:Uncharacterized protein n=1 Tax=Araneus ventricosus TaxID=182803 RepID=A0A4Y2B3D2_ARAVE|nr:hypothetical protein AVEN_164517-1 [Araneus ventricosus]